MSATFYIIEKQRAVKPKKPGEAKAKAEKRSSPAKGKKKEKFSK